ncbi:cytochrome b [Pseudoxanthomonas mexicana]|uniref:cytochrome b n=1 Tax=Pseudoxanthomonas mexicana TaxID=128785 RepID=UPI00398BA3E8
MSRAVREGRYRLPARLLHWLVAIAVPAQIWLGWTAERTQEREAGFRLLHLHFQLGMILLALMVLRASWRIAHGVPAPAAAEPAWRRRLAAAMHWTLYALLLALPLSGYVIWVWMDAPMQLLGSVQVPRLFEPPADDETWRALAWYVHYYSAWALAGLVVLHAAVALWHEFVLGDRLIRRRMM